MSRRLVRWILFSLVLATALLVLTAAYFKVWIFDRTPVGLVITPNRTRLPEPTYYQFDGFPDFVETMNQAAKKDITPGSNAAVDCLRALGPLSSTPDHWAYLCESMEFEPNEKDVLLEIPTIESYRSVNGERELSPTLWRSEDFPAMADLLDRNQDVLSRLREASKKQRFYLPMAPHPSGSMLELLLHHEQGMREIVRQLSYDAARAVEQGNFERAIEDAEAILRFAKHLETPPQVIVKALVACAHKTQGFQTLQLIAIEIQNRRPPEAIPLLRRIQSIIERNKEPTDFHSSMDHGERFMLICTIMRMAYYGVQSQENLDQIPPINPTYLRSCDWSQIVDEGNEFFDRTLEPLKTEDYDQITLMKERLEMELRKISGGKLALSNMVLAKLSRRARTEMMKRIMLGLLMPAFSNLADARIRLIAQTRLTYTTALLSEYALEHGSYPNRLEELDPAPGTNWTFDPFTNQPFIYEFPSQKTRYRLHTLGPNRIDNHGKLFGEIGADDISPFLPNLEGVPMDINEAE